MTLQDIIIKYLKENTERAFTKEEVLNELPSYGKDNFKVFYNMENYHIRLEHVLNDKKLLNENGILVGEVITKDRQKGIYIREL